MLKKAEMEVKNKKANIYFFCETYFVIAKNKLVERGRLSVVKAN